MEKPQSSNVTAQGSKSDVSAWSPLQGAVFCSIWIATVVSNVGTWMQSGGVVCFAVVRS